MAGGKLFKVPRKGAQKKVSVSFGSKVRSIMQRSSELKHTFNDFALSYTSANPDSNFVNVSQLSTGSTDITRVGDLLRPVSLYLGLGGGYTGSNSILRILVFQWNSVSSPSIAEILTTFADGQDLTLSTINVDAIKARKLKVFKDMLINVNSNAPKIGQRHYISLKGARKVGYIGGSTTAGGHIYFWVISDSGATNPPYLTVNWQSKFSNI